MESVRSLTFVSPLKPLASQMNWKNSAPRHRFCWKNLESSLHNKVVNTSDKANKNIQPSLDRYWASCRESQISAIPRSLFLGFALGKKTLGIFWGKIAIILAYLLLPRSGKFSLAAGGWTDQLWKSQVAMDLPSLGNISHLWKDPKSSDSSNLPEGLYVSWFPGRYIKHL